MNTPFKQTHGSFSFVKEVQEVSVSDYLMVSFDVCSQFTNIPLNEAIDLAVDIIFDNNQSMNVTKPQLKKLFVFATSQFHFLFNNEIHDQTNRVAMESLLGPALLYYLIFVWLIMKINGLILKRLLHSCFIGDRWHFLSF